MHEIVLDSSMDGEKVYLLTLQCKECNEERRWGSPIQPFCDGIAERITSIAITDSMDNDITLNFKAISKYKDIPLGFLYLEKGNSTVRKAVELDSLSNYFNGIDFSEIWQCEYNKTDSSFYISMLYQIKNKGKKPKELILKLENKTLRFDVPSNPTQVNVSCIIPKDQEYSVEASKIRDWR